MLTRSVSFFEREQRSGFTQWDWIHPCLCCSQHLTTAWVQWIKRNSEFGSQLSAVGSQMLHPVTWSWCEGFSELVSQAHLSLWGETIIPVGTAPYIWASSLWYLCYSNNRKPMSISSGSGTFSKNGVHLNGTRQWPLTHSFHKNH